MSERQTPTNWTGIGIGIYVVTVGMAGWHMAWQGTLGLPVYMALALVSGGFAGCMASRDLPWTGLVCGMVGAAFSLAAVYYYHRNKDVASNYSIALTVMAGSVPAWLLYFGVRKMGSQGQ